MKFSRVVFEIREQTDRQTDKTITVLCTHLRKEVIKQPLWSDAHAKQHNTELVIIISYYIHTANGAKTSHIDQMLLNSMSIQSYLHLYMITGTSRCELLSNTRKNVDDTCSPLNYYLLN